MCIAKIVRSLYAITGKRINRPSRRSSGDFTIRVSSDSQVKMDSRLLLTCSILLFAKIALSFETRDLQTIFQWKYLNLKFDNAQDEEAANKLKYKENTMIFDTDVRRESNGKETYFVTAVGTAPASLLVVTDEENENGRLLKPFPDWSWANLDKYGCKHTIVGVYRIAVDHCHRVWLVDTGMRGDDNVCPPKLVVFGANNEVIINQKIPRNILTTSMYSTRNTKYEPVKLPANIVLDIKDKRCLDLRGAGRDSVRAFIADVDGYSLIWWQNHVFKRLFARQFEPQKGASLNYTINGLSFDLADGILGMAVGRNIHSNEFYFSPFASYGMNEMNKNWFDAGSSDYVGPTYPLVMSRIPGGIKAHKAPIVYAANKLCFALAEKQNLVCWNPAIPFDEDYLDVIAATNQFNLVSGLKAKNRPWDGPIGPLFPGSTIYGCTDFIITSNPYQKYVNGGLNINEVNFRVFKKHCAVREPWQGYNY